MPKTPPPGFQIHVDSSCLTNSTDLMMAPDRVTSSETIVHHEPETEDPPAEEEEKVEENNQENNQENEEENPEEYAETEFSDPTTSELARERQIDRIEAQIQAAARAVV